ncbi:hypothetical protein EPH95_01570 [Salicibibacter halophilus]|uniref:Uncharacterized protein n=1 Tax=Salicibibacter halophilus TaxID=2502791 RepID=A0A514LDU2_9BACI|nr:hypothetical protein [Salicibibacter halophilus]QDI90023.1 hypothetical protein EPH95_01570 [Salicibibacter halophilus]
MLAARKQRLQTFARWRRQMNVHERIRENEQLAILEREMPRFINMTMPVFLLRPEMERKLHQFLQTADQQRISSKQFFKKSGHDQGRFYQNELLVFIKYLRRQGFDLNGHEALFAHVLLNHLAISNLQRMQKRYGGLALRGDSLTDVFDRYLHLVDEKDYTSVGHLEYLRQTLVSKRIVPVTMSQNKLKRQLKQYEKNHEDLQIYKFEKRLQKNTN